MVRTAPGNLTLTYSPPVIPPSGVVVGTLGSKFTPFSGVIAWEYAPQKWGGASAEIFYNGDAVSLGAGVKAATIAKALGYIPPATNIIGMALNSLEGGGFVDTKGRFGLYYQATAFKATF